MHESTLPSLTTSTSLSEPSILVVDDDAKSRFATMEILRPLGCSIEEAESCERALQRAAARTFTVILLDVRMPRRDGFATAEALRAEGENHRTPIIFHTADPQPTDVRRAYALGASDFLAKPFDPTVLLAKVDIFISLQRRSEELRQRTIALRDAEVTAVLAAEALKSAHERDRLRDVFIGILGHDLRNPLGAIGMGAQLLLTHELPPTSRVVVGKILSSVERMGALIRDVLDFARGQLGNGIPIAVVETNMASACQAVVDEQRLRWPTRTIDLDLHGDLRGRWDRERVEQALSNLVSNAIQHGTGDVRVIARGEQDAVVVAVHNVGTPIPKDALSDVFEPFRKADTSAAGLGLGLYIVREIVRAHRADIEVESTLAQGTSFTIRWPRLSGTPARHIEA
jgi:signal transduction histidine kinase